MKRLTLALTIISVPLALALPLLVLAITTPDRDGPADSASIWFAMNQAGERSQANHEKFLQTAPGVQCSDTALFPGSRPQSPKTTSEK